MKKIACLACLAAVATSATLLGGVKYWDNPAFKAFDVGDYASGAVWNYDGIRNQGADQPHSTTATTWKNIGSSGASNNLFVRYRNAAGNGWANSSAPASLGVVDGRNLGSWTENGFVLTGDSEWRTGSGSISTGTDYTLQMVVEATVNGQTVNFPYFMSVNASVFAFNMDKAAYKLNWTTQSTSGPYPFMSGTAFSYITAIINSSDKTATFFDGTTPPTSGNGFKQYDSVIGRNETGYCIGGSTSAGNCMAGTIHSYRYYKRVLTQEELVWNRVVDEARFFGRRAPLPITNVVVASSFRHEGGTEPAGCYALDADGYTFTAPAATNFVGRTYACTGYTLETWDGTAWGVPEAHAGELSCTLSDTTALVRLTWQWEAGDGLVTYDIDDYVWDGLVWFYDGIYNIGALLPHSTNSTTWFNIGSGGDAFNLARTQMSDGDLGEWKDDGYEFRGYTRYKSAAAVGPLKSHTMQILLDADVNEQNNDNTWAASMMWDAMSIGLSKSTAKPLFWYTQSQNRLLVDDSTSYDYATALFDYDAKTAAFFSGTTPPTSGIGFKQFSSVASRSTTGYGLGCTSTATDAFTGVIKMFRYYDRVLTLEEIVRNRNVDAVRYYGALATTNVLVVAGESGVLAETACKVEGEWTFTATNTVNSRGEAVAVKRYSVEELVNGEWANKTTHDGMSYTYTEGTDPETVRLTWLGPPSGTLLVVR